MRGPEAVRRVSFRVGLVSSSERGFQASLMAVDALGFFVGLGLGSAG